MSLTVKLIGPYERTVYDSAQEELALAELSTVTELNAAGSAKLGFPFGHLYHDSLDQLIIPYRTIVEISQGDDLVFRGRALPPSTNFYRTVSVPCEGELAFLCDSAVEAGTLSGTPSSVLSSLLSGHNAQADAFKRFVLGTVALQTSSVSVDLEPCSTMAALNKLLEKYGGYISISASGTDRAISWSDTAAANGQPVVYGGNLLDLTKTYNAELVNRVIAYGKTTNGVRLTLPSPGYVEDASSIATYGVLAKAVVFNDAENQTALQSAAQAYLDAHKALVSSFTLRAVDLSAAYAEYEFDDLIVDTSRFETGKTLQVISAPHGINGSWMLTRCSCDWLNRSNDKLTLGALPDTVSALLNQ